MVNKERARDLRGRVFARLTVTGRYYETDQKITYARWKCRCLCGNTTIAPTSALIHGERKSCGCLKRDYPPAKTHGKYGSTAYRAWAGMKSRCTLSSQENYYLYGGRGIKACSRWQTFENFYADMGDPPQGMTLDRIDNDGDYSPENCRWADVVTQANNKRNTRRITFSGVTLSLTQWSRIVGIHRTAIADRLDRGGWSIEDALMIRKRQNKKIGRPIERISYHQIHEAILGHVHRAA